MNNIGETISALVDMFIKEHLELYIFDHYDFINEYCEDLYIPLDTIIGEAIKICEQVEMNCDMLR